MGGILWTALALMPAFAQEVIYETGTGRTFTVDEFTATRSAGEVLILGEQHALAGSENDPETADHHNRQVRLLNALTAVAITSSWHLNVAMEFLAYTFQESVDQFVHGALEEAVFLKTVAWGSSPFQFYRTQILTSPSSGGRTIALNIPTSISSQVAKGGPSSLNPQQRALLPPVWEKGGAEYFERFQDAMGGGHIPPEKMENYFWAQSLWDDTMAWRTLKSLADDPRASVAIIVGEFHVEFGHGLKARLLRHGAAKVNTILQVSVKQWNSANLAEATRPDSRYGHRADYLWILRVPGSFLKRPAPARRSRAFQKRTGYPHSAASQELGTQFTRTASRQSQV